MSLKSVILVKISMGGGKVGDAPELPVLCPTVFCNAGYFCFAFVERFLEFFGDQ